MSGIGHLPVLAAARTRWRKTVRSLRYPWDDDDWDEPSPSEPMWEPGDLEDDDEEPHPEHGDFWIEPEEYDAQSFPLAVCLSF